MKKTLINKKCDEKKFTLKTILASSSIVKKGMDTGAISRMNLILSKETEEFFKYIPF